MERGEKIIYFETNLKWRPGRQPSAIYQKNLLVPRPKKKVENLRRGLLLCQSTPWSSLSCAAGYKFFPIKLDCEVDCLSQERKEKFILPELQVYVKSFLGKQGIGEIRKENKNLEEMFPEIIQEYDDCLLIKKFLAEQNFSAVYQMLTEGRGLDAVEDILYEAVLVYETPALEVLNFLLDVGLISELPNEDMLDVFLTRCLLEWYCVCVMVQGCTLSASTEQERRRKVLQSTPVRGERPRQEFFQSTRNPAENLQCSFSKDVLCEPFFINFFESLDLEPSLRSKY